MGVIPIEPGSARHIDRPAKRISVSRLVRRLLVLASNAAVIALAVLWTSPALFCHASISDASS